MRFIAVLRGKFTICLGLAGSERPARFETSPGSGHALEELVRVANARPTDVDGGSPQPVDSVRAPAGASESFETSVTPTLQKLQGYWLPLELITSDKPLETTYLPFGSRSHSGLETKVVFGGQTMVHAKVRFNEAASPIEVDYLNLSGKGKGAISRGLFRWDGEEAVYCMAAPGAAGPSDFTCHHGSGRTFSRWKRKP